MAPAIVRSRAEDVEVEAGRRHCRVFFYLTGDGNGRLKISYGKLSVIARLILPFTNEKDGVEGVSA